MDNCHIPYQTSFYLLYPLSCKYRTSSQCLQNQTARAENLFIKQPVELACLAVRGEKSCLTYAILISCKKKWVGEQDLQWCFKASVLTYLNVFSSCFYSKRDKVPGQKCKAFLHSDSNLWYILACPGTDFAPILSVDLTASTELTETVTFSLTDVFVLLRNIIKK